MLWVSQNSRYPSSRYRESTVYLFLYFSIAALRLYNHTAIFFSTLVYISKQVASCGPYPCEPMWCMERVTLTTWPVDWGMPVPRAALSTRSGTDLPASSQSMWAIQPGPLSVQVRFLSFCTLKIFFEIVLFTRPNGIKNGFCCLNIYSARVGQMLR